MRKLKFRVFHPNLGVSPEFTIEKLLNRAIQTDFQHSRLMLLDKRTKWMQYTGINDRKGKEIYEGDIVRYRYQCDGDSTIWIVKFGIGNTNSLDYYGDDFCGYYIEDSVGDTYSLTQEETVIGNIYENKDLLEK